jgi:hypothetical protein
MRIPQKGIPSAVPLEVQFRHKVRDSMHCFKSWPRSSPYFKPIIIIIIIIYINE